MKINKDGTMEMEYLADGAVNDGFSDDKKKNERIIREIEFHRNLMLIEEVFGKNTRKCRKKTNEFIDDFIMEEIENTPMQTRKAFLRAM